MDDQYTGYLEDSSEDAEHYGTPRHSGRYPWGSGKNPQHNKIFLQRARDLQKQGLTSTEVARAFNMSTTQYRALYSSAMNEEKADTILQVRKLKEKGMSNTAIGEKFGLPESTIRNYLKDDFQERTNSTRNVAEALKKQIESKPYLDVGKGVNRQLGITDTQLKTAVEMLKLEGYKTHDIKVEQATNPRNYTIVKVLTKDDVPTPEVKENRWQITSPEGIFFTDRGSSVREIKKPVSINSDRVMVRYGEDGGAAKDGVIELRKGVEDLTLGKYMYGQVRIAVDDTHYMKGMAIYSDAKDWPKGVDIIYNTYKTKDVPKIGEDKDNTVLKPIKMDKKDPTQYKTPENPFGAVTEQFDYFDKNGEPHQSPINFVNKDEDWDKWKKTLSSQFLSKQPVATAKQQLAVTYRQKEEEFNEIMALTNPTIKRKLLESFAEDCDAAAVHLKAAAFPRQASHAILPIISLKDDEVYAPNYNQGEEVILVRYPHEGIFQIPRLRVNNNNPEGKAVLGQAKHAIGINAHVAEQLSGADFDGDTVAVIPTIGQKFNTKKVLDGLKDFEPSRAYPAYEGMTRVGEGDGFNKGREMGIASNLITDMTIRGATEEQIVRAVRYSMTVIDAEKHNLNWKLSYKDNRIQELKDEFQDGGGASTLISRAKGEIRIPERKELVSTKQMTDEEKERYLNGEKIYRNTDDYHVTYKKVNGKIPVDENGKKIWIETGKKPNETTLKNLEYVSDAHELSSGFPIEEVYADHSNRLKALANRARKEYLATGRLQQNASAKVTYAKEVDELKAALNVAAKNAPYERQAQLLASSIIASIRKDNPDMGDDELKRLRSVQIDQARRRVGSISRKKLGIEITDRQWEAIQAGAISDSLLGEILRYTDTSEIQKRATPRTAKEFSPAAKARARTLLNMGYTQAQVAEELGVSVSTINKEVNGVLD